MVGNGALQMDKAKLGGVSHTYRPHQALSRTRLSLFKMVRLDTKERESTTRHPKVEAM